MKLYWLALGILGGWQITSLLHAGDGPWNSLSRLRAMLLHEPALRFVGCFYCLTMWIAMPLAFWIGDTWPERVLLWFALAGGASLIQRAVEGRSPPVAVYFEDASVTEDKAVEQQEHLGGA